MAERRRREWLFRSGSVVPEPPAVEVSSVALPSGFRWEWAEDYHPFGAPWWRPAGTAEWLPVPGRATGPPPAALAARARVRVRRKRKKVRSDGSFFGG